MKYLPIHGQNGSAHRFEPLNLTVLIQNFIDLVNIGGFYFTCVKKIYEKRLFLCILYAAFQGFHNFKSSSHRYVSHRTENVVHAFTFMRSECCRIIKLQRTTNDAIRHLIQITKNSRKETKQVAVLYKRTAKRGPYARVSKENVNTLRISQIPPTLVASF